MMKYYLTCTFLFAGFLTELVFGGNGLEKADSLFLAGNYYPAAVEYERAAFLSANNSIRTIFLLKKSECFKQMGSYADAEKTIERINYMNLSDTLIAEARYQSALCSYLAGNFSSAENHLLQMHTFISDSNLTRNSLPLYALVLNELQRWEDAKKNILKTIDFGDMPPEEKDSLRKIVSQIYAQKNYPHLKNLLKAQKMSAFVPGLGQLYAGYFWEGAASAFLNVASLGLTGYFIYVRLYFTAATAGTAVFSKFYLGGSNRLVYLVEKKNYKLLRGYNEELKKIILRIE